ncbi:MAG: gamma-glutamylcyclotransferase family protein [Candidatus Scalindua sp.]
MKPIFFYGLFMDDELLREKGFNPTFGKIAYVDGYGLRIGERATLVKSEGERSYGLVMELREEELEQLYSDSSVSDYVPELVEATDLNGAIANVYSYNLPISKLSGSNKSYAKSLSVVAQKKGLPQNYINEILTWAK